VLIDWQRLTETFRAGGAVMAPELADPAGRDGSPAGAPRDRLRLAQERAAISLPSLESNGGERESTGPDASLVARDWSGPRIFVGHLSPIDRIRMSHSSRMLVGRLRIPAGRITPFGQLGLGQWRIDPEVVPHRSDIAYAAQLGYGFELAVSSFATVAFEADYTVLYRDRDQPCPPQAGPPGLWGAFLAARGRF
jgi:hypothetical protein